MVNDFYYNKGKQITREEAHALKDKSGLVVADRAVDFSKEFKGTRLGKAEDFSPELDKEI
jgi:hypothetical protein